MGQSTNPSTDFLLIYDPFQRGRVQYVRLVFPILRQIGVYGPDELHAVFALAGSSEEKCARDAAMTVGNLAVVAGNQVAIAEAGGLAPMVGMVSGSQYTSCQKFAARALYRLAAHGSNRPLIVAQGGLPPLVRRLRSPDAEVAR